VFATPWFTSLYSCYIRSWPLFLRFFDLYCLEGEIAIYRFGISFLSLHQHTITSLSGIETLLPFLQNMGSRSSLDGKQGHNLLTIALNIKKSILLSDLILAKSEASNPLPYSSPTGTPSVSRKRPALTTTATTVEDVPRTPSLGRFTEGFSSLLNSVKKQCTEMFTPIPATLFTPSTRQQLAASYNSSSVLRSSTRPVVVSSIQRQPYPKQPPSASTSASVTRSARQRMVHASSPTSTPRVRSVIPSSSTRQQQQPQQQPTPSMFSCSFASSPTSIVSSIPRHPSSHRRILAAVSPTPASPTTSLLKRKRPLPLHLMNQSQPPVSPVKTQKIVSIMASPQDKENEFGVVASSPPSSKRPRTPLSSSSVSRDPPTSPTRSPPSIRLSRISSLRSKTVSPSPTSAPSTSTSSSSSTLRSPSAPSSIRRSRMISPKLRISSPSIKPKRVPLSEVENLSPGPALMKQSFSSTPLPLHRLRTDAATLLRSPYHSHRSFC
jgi:hypothetical protein